MLHLMMTARLQDIVEAYEIALDIGIRVRDGITDTGLRGKIDHYGNPVVTKNLLYCILVRNRRVDECPVSAEDLDFAQALVLYIDVVIIGDTVDTDDADIVNVREQALDEVAADEAGSTGHEDSLAFESYVVTNHN